MSELQRHLNNVVNQVNLFGTNIQYKRYLSTVYQDPVRHLNPIKTYEDPSSIKVKLDYQKARSMEGFIEGDLNLCLPGNVDFTPSIEDKVIYDSKTFSILRITPCKIGSGIVYYDILARASK